MAKPKTANTFNHASHNYSVYSKLKELDCCNDWVITTSFYSAMKFMESELFPGDFEHPKKYGEIVNFKSFPNYAHAHGRLEGNNKHKIMSNLIERYVDNNDVINSYKDLKDASHTARYIDYKIGEDRLNQCEEAIEIIKNFCSE